MGNYRIIDVLGEGGMGTVYRGRNEDIDRTVAIKVLAAGLTASEDIVRRFRVEARLINKIQHPNIVDVQDFGALASGRPYYIMELLQGESLQSYLNRVGPLSVQETISLLDPLLEALHVAHQAGVVHRDLKPENIFLVSRPGGTVMPKLLDFGIAKVFGDADGGGLSSATRTGSLMGTPKYMSPEQASGRVSEIGPPSDLYSMGIIAYEMLTGAAPFCAEAFGDLLIMHMQQAPAPLASRRPGLPAALDALIMNSLAKRPSERPASAMAFRSALLDSMRHGGVVIPSAPTLMAPVVARVFHTPLPMTHTAPAGSAQPPLPPAGFTVAPATIKLHTIPPPPLRPRSSRVPLIALGAVAVVVALGATAVVTCGGHSSPHGPLDAAVTSDSSVAALLPDAALTGAGLTAAAGRDASVPVDLADAAPLPASMDAATTSEIERRLQALKNLHDDGLIDDREYARRRQQILEEF